MLRHTRSSERARNTKGWGEPQVKSRIQRSAPPLTILINPLTAAGLSPWLPTAVGLWLSCPREAIVERSSVTTGKEVTGCYAAVLPTSTNWEMQTNKVVEATVVCHSSRELLRSGLRSIYIRRGIQDASFYFNPTRVSLPFPLLSTNGGKGVRINH